MLIDFTICIVIWLIAELLYFRLAEKFNIVDRPNSRSSHTQVTIRGGGIIFPLAAIPFLPFQSEQQILVSASILVIAVLSFIDDIKSIDSKVRLVIQSMTVAGLLYFFADQIGLMWLLALFVLITGIINAYNFMDGINGITILYSIVIMGSIYWVSKSYTWVLPDSFFMSMFASFAVFSFFNLRKKAKCFAGDVGSVSLALIFCFLVLKLVIDTGFVYWLLFLGIYGIDTIFTIFCRILRKEPLMKAHRSHFYQYLVNEVGLSHLLVSGLYALAQLIFNFIIIYSFENDFQWLPAITLFVFLIIYTIFRVRLEGRNRLFVDYKLS